MKQPQTITGRITTTRKGLGFIADPSQPEKDLMLEQGKLHGALNGDIVEVQPLGIKVRGQSTAEVVTILQRSRDTFVGTIEKEGPVFIVVPDDKKLYTNFNISKASYDEHQAKLTPGLKVHIRMLPWTDTKKYPEADIIRVIGNKGNNEAEMESIVLEKGFDTRFPAPVEEEAKKIEQFEKKINDAEVALRKDFRQTLTVTIDPVDAKDFDDAISYKKLPDENGEARYEIGVHIADVSHYVRPGSALDREALHRGCSIYLVDRTIPMLPEVLSNDVCSLNPHEDKLTFSAVFIVNNKGTVKERWFGRTVINSAHRFSYESAQESIDTKAGPYADELITLNTIAKELQKDKFHKGAIEFEQEEIRFKLDENGKPIGVYKKERLETHKLVEEYMLLANREVAKFIHDSIKSKGHRDTGSIYRIHDTPDPDKIADLALFVKALGYNLKVENDTVTSRSLNNLLSQIENTPHESLVRTAAIRSMQKAIYSTKNIGHFGLAFDFYTHFTSPIRRYPDLLVHRVLEMHLKHQKFDDNAIKQYEEIATRSTKREIDAAEAERASKKLKQVEYMSEHIGEVFQGTISGVTEWGIYVEEKDTKCEGMIKIGELGDDFYEFNKKTYSITGVKTKKKYTLGDTITFKVIGADLDRKTLDYSLVRDTK